jgi:hypothetical protein
LSAVHCCSLSNCNVFENCCRISFIRLHVNDELATSALSTNRCAAGVVVDELFDDRDMRALFGAGGRPECAWQPLTTTGILYAPVHLATVGTADCTK